MSLFEDSFGATPGTLLTAGGYVPTLLGGSAGTGHWKILNPSLPASFQVSNANRAMLSATNYATICCDVVPPTYDYTVECDVVVLSIVDGLWWAVLSHADDAPDGLWADRWFGFEFNTFTPGAIQIRFHQGWSTEVNWTWGDAGIVTGTGQLTAGNTYHVKIVVTGARLSSTVTGYLTRANGDYLQHDGTWTAVETSLCSQPTVVGLYPDRVPNIGSVGFYHHDLSSQSGGLHFDNVSVSGSAFSVGVIQPATMSATAIGLSSSAASGGTAPYFYEWQRAPTATGTFAALAGATGLTHSDTTAVVNTDYWYRMKYTDSAGIPATGYSATTVYGRRALSPAVIGFIGDSITFTSPGTVSKCVTLLSDLLAVRTVTGNNQGIGSTYSSDWTSGSTALNTALAGFAGSGVEYVHVMLGTNDAQVTVSAAAYGVNMASLVAGLTGAGYKVILSVPIYTTGAGFTYAERQLLIDYQAKLVELVNGTTVRLGDTKSYHYFAANAAYLDVDGVHPSPAGQTALAGLWADVISKIIEPSGGGVGSLIGGGLVS